MKNALSLLALFMLFAAGSCKKGDDTSVAGKGGAGTLSVLPKHHSKQVTSCTVFIKYNAVDAPLSGIYDDSAACIAVNDTLTATFTGLKKGNYYLYGYGWDAKNLTPAQHVKGGFAYPLQDEGTHTTDLAISEE